MTTINPNSVGNKNFKQVESDSWTSMYLPAICAAILMGSVLFLAISCSKKSGSMAKISPPAQPSVAAPASAPVAAVAEKPKKAVKKHRPANATYINSEYGVSFSYPRKYSLQSGDKLAVASTTYLKPGSLPVAAVDMPDTSYPETDFTSAVFSVNVNKGMTSDECMQFIPTSEQAGEVKPSAVKLGENEFSVFEQINGQDNKKSDLKFFHLFKNNACYEFAAALDTTEAPEDMAQVDRGKVFQQLEKILTSAKIKDMQTSDVESADQTPSTALPIADSKIGEGKTDDTKVADSNTANAKTSDTANKTDIEKPNQN